MTRTRRARRRAGKRAQNLLLAGSALALSVYAAEGILRVAVASVDYLQPELVPDSILRWRVQPNSAGHDRWGYRNRSVPDSVEVLALGDSQTYGHGAVAAEAWPAWLERTTGRKVYNMGLGGYGPLDYRYLGETYLDSLRPRLVVVGLYLGNDLIDAYRSTYRTEYWRGLRIAALDTIQGTREAPESLPGRDRADGFTRALKLWMAEHSVLYGMVASLGRHVVRVLVRKHVSGWDPELVLLRDSSGRHVTALDPQRRFRRLDQRDSTVVEGLRLTFISLEAIDLHCRRNNTRLHIVIIPTKEAVFAGKTQSLIGAESKEHMARLADSEQQVSSSIKTWLDDHGIAYSDALPGLRRAVREGLGVYPRTENGHPTGSGYAVIAKAIERDLSCWLRSECQQ